MKFGFSYYFRCLLIVAGLAMGMTACSDEDSGKNSSDIIGTWFGERSYENPVGGTKWTYLTLTFNVDGSGQADYESPAYVKYGRFTWKDSKGKVACKGILGSASTDGDIDVDTEFNLTLVLEGRVLRVVEGSFPGFVLTRDGSSVPNPDDEPAGDDKPSSDGNTGGSTDIKSKATAKCSYSDFYYNMTITSTLESDFPGRKIEYSMPHGRYGADYLYAINASSSADSGASMSISTSGSTTTVRIKEPFYYYFVARQAEDPSMSWKYSEIIANCQMYLNSYRSLVNSGPLSKEERELLEVVTEELRRYEREALSEGCVQACVTVSGVGSAVLGTFCF